MPKLKIDLVHEGMVVGSDVKNLDNMLLIPSGSTLTERQVNILKSWGVNEVEIAADENDSTDDPLTQLSSEEVEKLLAEVKERFWQVDETNPVFMEIFKLILQRRMRSGLAEPAAV